MLQVFFIIVFLCLKLYPFIIYISDFNKKVSKRIYKTSMFFILILIVFAHTHTHTHTHTFIHMSLYVFILIFMIHLFVKIFSRVCQSLQLKPKPVCMNDYIWIYLFVWMIISGFYKQLPSFSSVLSYLPSFFITFTVIYRPFPILPTFYR